MKKSKTLGFLRPLHSDYQSFPLYIVLHKDVVTIARRALPRSSITAGRKQVSLGTAMSNIVSALQGASAQSKVPPKFNTLDILIFFTWFYFD